MTKERKHKTEALTPLCEGEFRRIDGIGEATEEKLHEAGIDTFELLASLTPEDIAGTLPGQKMVKERAIAKDWIGQARGFAEALAKDKMVSDIAGQEERQHTESFILDLLINDTSSIRRTRITAARGEAETHWPGWLDSDELASWLAAQCDLPVEAFSAAPMVQAKPAAAEAHPRPPGAVQATEATVRAKGARQPRRFYEAGEPLELELGLDLSEVNTPPGSPLAYQASIEACQMETGRRLRLGEIQGECPAGEQMTLIIPVTGAEEGTYDLAAVIQLFPAGSSRANGDGLRATSEGGLVHFYLPFSQPGG